MQISHDSDRLSQVSFGAGEARSARMGNSAAFYHILSSSLYSAPFLAALREVICNAEDPHLQAGITRPIEVSIIKEVTGATVVVRDFGPGIPDDKMDDVYLVFGDSTKKDDDAATGGFGLGSKAPWAIAEQFYVTSNCNGIKTMYTLVKSDPDQEGRPAIKTLTSMPTDETGLEVRIPIQLDEVDNAERIIRSLAYFGDMDILFTGANSITAPLKKMGVPREAGMVALTPGTDSNGINIRSVLASHLPQLLVRYGPVLYPVNPEFSGDLPFVTDHFWVIQAPPGSLSLAPSRETLTYTDITKETLKELVQATLVGLTKIPLYSSTDAQLLSTTIRQVISSPDETCNVNQLLDRSYCSMGQNLDYIVKPSLLAPKMSQILKARAAPSLHPLMDYRADRACRHSVRISSVPELRKMWLTHLAEDLEARGLRKGKAFHLARVVRYLGTRHASEAARTNSRKAEPKFIRETYAQLRKNVRSSKIEVSWKEFNEDLVSPNLLHYRPMHRIALARRHLIIGRTRHDLEHSNEGTFPCLALRTSSAKLKDEYIRVFSELGWYVEDEWTAPVRAQSETKPQTVKHHSKNGGYPRASLAVMKPGYWDSRLVEKALRANPDDASLRVEKPIAYLAGKTNKRDYSSQNLSTMVDVCSRQTREFLGQVAFSANQRQTDALQKAGIPELSEYAQSWADNANPVVQMALYLAVSEQAWLFVHRVAGVDKEDVLQPLRDSDAPRYVMGFFKILAHMNGVGSHPDTLHAQILLELLNVRYSRSNYSWNADRLTKKCGEDLDKILTKLPKINVPKLRLFIDYKSLFNAVNEGDIAIPDVLSTYFD